MPQISPGVRISIRGEDFIVTEKKSENIIEVEGISELVQGFKFQFDLALDEAEIISPDLTKLVADTSLHCRQTKLYIETTLRNSTFRNDAIQIADKAAIHGANYQFVPTSKALELVRPRILIADAVGLGKTVQVGIFFAELIRRGKGQRILVVTPKSILAQFQQEIWSRFSIPLVRLDSTGIARVKSEIPTNKNPFEYYDKIIVSIDTLKNNAKFRRYLEKTHWDIVAIDECHTVANPSSLRGDLAMFLAQKSEALVLTSATPHNGKRRNFANLMIMLEPTSIPFNGEFKREDIQPYYVRRFKKDIESEVGDAFRERITEKINCQLHPLEEKFLLAQQALKQITKKQSGTKIPAGAFLFSILLFKAYMSAPEACLSTINKRLAKGLDDETVKEQLQMMQRTLESIVDKRLDSKYHHLKAKLNELGWVGKKSSDRIIIFAERLNTLNALNQRLKADYKLLEKSVTIFHGGLSDTEQTEIIEDFSKEDSDIRLFLASDAGSQGVNLHFYCNHMFNYDVPWSIITLEQRNGRIDRFGQAKTPYIYYLISQSTNDHVQGDIRILEKLKEKEEEVYKSLGDPGNVFMLFEPEKEEQKVMEAIANSDESLLDTTSDETIENFWTDFLDNPPETNSNIVKKELGYTSFYEDDFDYYLALKDQVIANEPALNNRFLIDKNEKTLEITLDKELSRDGVLYNLPAEVFPSKKGTFKLTTNKDIVEQSIQQCRKKKGEWPNFHLLYDIHPLARWMQFKLLAKIDKGKALVVKNRSLPNGSAWYLFQGMCSNNLGQPLLTKFFVVSLNMDGTSRAELLDYKAFINQFRLTENFNALPISTEEILKLEDYIPDAVAEAQTLYMSHKQDLLREEKEVQLEDYQKKLHSWAADATNQLELKFSEVDGVLAWQKDRKQREIKTILDSKSQFLKDLTLLENEPFLRLLTVFFNP